MNTIALNSLWSYLQSLALTTSNKKWLANHLYEAAKEEGEGDIDAYTTVDAQDLFSTSTSRCEYIDSDALSQLDTLQKARALTKEQLIELNQQEYIAPEELRLLLYRTVDDIYCTA